MKSFFEKLEKMPTTTKSGKYVMQITISKEDYQKLRKEAFAMETTVNKAIVILALKAVERK